MQDLEDTERYPENSSVIMRTTTMSADKIQEHISHDSDGHLDGKFVVYCVLPLYWWNCLCIVNENKLKRKAILNHAAPDVMDELECQESSEQEISSVKPVFSNM